MISISFYWILTIVANTFISKMFSEAYFPPSFVTQPPKGDYLYRIDSTVVLPCFVKAIPNPNYEWLKNGRPIENLVVNQNDGSLRIERAMKENEGSYQCMAHNYLGGAISHKTELKMSYISSYSSLGERTIEVFLGGSAILECDRPACYPPPSIQWVNVKQGVKIISFEEDYRRVLDDKGNLHITKILKEDDGEVYSCISTNTFLRTMKRGADTKIKLKTHTVSSLPSKSLITLYHSKTDITVLLNSTVTLSCIFSRGGVRWFRYTPRKVELKINDRIKMIRQGTSLEIMNVTENDSGKYTCQPDSNFSKLSVKFLMKVVEKPSFLKSPTDITVAINGSHVFECMVSGQPTPTIIWTWNTQDIQRRLDGNRIHLHDNKLYLNHLTPNDIGTLQCNASNIYGYVFTNAFINVWNKKPLFLQFPQKYMKGVLQKNALIICNAFSVPAPRIEWKKDSYKLNFDLPNKYQIDYQGNLLIRNLNTNDAGVYDCTATNIFGYTKGESTIVIRESTKIISFSENKRQLISTDALLECSAKTDRLEGQHLIIAWWKNNENLKTSRSQSASLLSSTLKLDTLSPKESGSYYCNASNGLDWDNKKIEVIVEGKPEPAQDVLVDCNKYSEKRLALISWLEGFDNNAKIISHIVEFKTQYDLETWFEVAPTNDTSFKNQEKQITKESSFAFLNIHPNLDYSFRIRSVNKLGISEPSETTVNKCQLKIQRPDLNPNNVFIFGSKPNTLKIIWKPMPYLHHNGPNMSYIVTIRCTNCEYLPPDSIYQLSIPLWKTDHLTISNLTSDIKYSQIEVYKRYGVKVQSMNSFGLCTTLPIEYFGYSAESYPTIAPSKAIVLEVTDHSVRLQWTVIYSSQMTEINGFFRGYRIEWCLNETSSELCDKKRKYQDEILFKPDDKELQHRFNQLNSFVVERRKRDTLSSSVIYGQLYTATLGNLPGMTSIHIWTRIINIQYAGPKSPEILIKTKEGTPSPVAEFSIETVEINYIEIAWAKPLTTNGILIGYDVSVKEIFPQNKAGNIVKTQNIKDPDQLRERISNLKPETKYQIYIWALTKKGRGKERFLTIQTRAESKESNLIQLRIERMEKNNFNMSVSFTELIQKQLDIPETGWKFYLQFKLVKKMMWEETEKQYQLWWRIVGNLLSDEIYLVRAVVNTNTGSIVTHSQLVKTGSAEFKVFSLLRGSGTACFIILLILIFGLLCGVIGLFIWRRKKILYMRGKPTMLVSQHPQLHNNTPSQLQDRYTSFITYSNPDNKNARFIKDTIENDYFAEKFPYYVQKMDPNSERKVSTFHPDNPNCTSVLHYSLNNPHRALSPINFSPSLKRISNNIPTTWAMPQTRPHLINNNIHNTNLSIDNENVYFQSFEYNPAQSPVSTSFV